MPHAMKTMKFSQGSAILVWSMTRPLCRQETVFASLVKTAGAQSLVLTTRAGNRIGPQWEAASARCSSCLRAAGPRTEARLRKSGGCQPNRLCPTVRTSLISRPKCRVGLLKQARAVWHGAPQQLKNAEITQATHYTCVVAFWVSGNKHFRKSRRSRSALEVLANFASRRVVAPCHSSGPACAEDS